MRISNLASFALGAALVMGIGMVGQTNAQGPNHSYELRKYFANPGKLEDLKARFRDHTDAIFKKHNIRVIGYWEPDDNKDNALIYIVDHASKAEAEKNWAAFNSDPEWQAVSKASDVNGKLNNHVESVYMHPTEFSPMK